MHSPAHCFFDLDSSFFSSSDKILATRAFSEFFFWLFFVCRVEFFFVVVVFSLFPHFFLLSCFVQPLFSELDLALDGGPPLGPREPPCPFPAALAALPWAPVEALAAFALEVAGARPGMSPGQASSILALKSSRSRCFSAFLRRSAFSR